MKIPPKESRQSNSTLYPLVHRPGPGCRLLLASGGTFLTPNPQLWSDITITTKAGMLQWAWVLLQGAVPAAASATEEARWKPESPWLWCMYLGFLPTQPESCWLWGMRHSINTSSKYWGLEETQTSPCSHSPAFLSLLLPSRDPGLSPSLPAHQS